jgi:ribokinase
MSVLRHALLSKDESCRRADRWPEYGAVVDLDARLTVPTLPGPGATVLGGAAATAPGGKGANQAVAAARLGADSGIHVRMVGCVGDDDFGRTLKATLTSEGIDDRAVRAAASLVAAGARNAVVTAGAAYHCEGRAPSGTVAAFPVRAVDTVGAGDTFVGALAVALAGGIAPREAVTAAAAAGAAAAARPGTQAGMPRPADIRAATGFAWPLNFAK